VRRLRKAGIQRALVSGSGEGAAQMLYEADPELVIPALRPYRSRGTTGSWMHDTTVVPYLKKHLAQFRYVAIGEFHLQGAEADLPVVREVVQLAKQHDLMLHVHSDADAIERIFQQDPGAHILWAHAGFEYASQVRSLLERYPNLWADLSFRREIYTNNRFLQGWRKLLIEHADRFMLGVDTYTPQRWLRIRNVMNWQRSLLDALPDDVARRIRFDNGERIIARRLK
jgi:predicted TIM-barrel fold metal-dependent hydrolase